MDPAHGISKRFQLRQEGKSYLLGKINLRGGPIVAWPVVGYRNLDVPGVSWRGAILAEFWKGKIRTEGAEQEYASALLRAGRGRGGRTARLRSRALQIAKRKENGVRAGRASPAPTKAKKERA